ncbi:uncharacterized protein LOC131681107 [Topomyia yanbarensis]|uniref:uncharacterized protein LOC131681107 n=1 Tax=Topomyia yanbarensis TaxID=2498891 RepID=UPI00273A96BA|nr:uncharacterized protein LOC131681107 [Topomyia yanbarensis]
MKLSHLISWSVILTFNSGHPLPKMSARLDGFESVNGSFTDFTKMRVRRFNQTHTVLNGTFEVLRNLGETLESGVICDRSAMRSNLLQRTPFKLPFTPFCDHMKTRYRYFQRMYSNYTNMPPVPPEGLCPFPKGSYWIKDLLVNNSMVPRMIPEGFWRCYLMIRDSTIGLITDCVQVFFTLTNELH